MSEAMLPNGAAWQTGFGVYMLGHSADRAVSESIEGSRDSEAHIGYPDPIP